MARRTRTKAAPQPEVTTTDSTQPVTHENEAEPVEPEPEPQTVAQEAPRTEPEPNGFAAQHAPRTPEVSERPQTHVDAVGKRGPHYNEQGITDKLAGAKLLEHHDPYFSIIRFEEKPSDAVREMLREASFRWEPQNKEWSRAIRFETRQQDRIDAERVFEQVCKTIRAERGITHEFGGAA